MNKFIEGTASNAMTLASDTASRVRDGVGRWVPGAIKAIGAGTNLIILRSGSKKIAGAVRRNPVTAAAALTVAVGVGVGLWILQRNRQRRAIEGDAPIEVKPVRVGRKPARRTTTRKNASRKTSTTASKPAAST